MKRPRPLVSLVSLTPCRPVDASSGPTPNLKEVLRGAGPICTQGLCQGGALTWVPCPGWGQRWNTLLAVRRDSGSLSHRKGAAMEATEDGARVSPSSLQHRRQAASHAAPRLRPCGAVARPNWKGEALCPHEETRVPQGSEPGGSCTCRFEPRFWDKGPSCRLGVAPGGLTVLGSLVAAGAPGQVRSICKGRSRRRDVCTCFIDSSLSATVCARYSPASRLPILVWVK